MMNVDVDQLPVRRLSRDSPFQFHLKHLPAYGRYNRLPLSGADPFTGRVNQNVTACIIRESGFIYCSRDMGKIQSNIQ